MVRLARERGALYLDTCIEPWAGGYVDSKLTVETRSNYTMRLEALALRDEAERAPTAVLTHGANPGLVSHLAKQALLNIAGDLGLKSAEPKNREEWAKLAQTLGVKVMHVAERDTQVSRVPKRPNEFVNTWSVDGFVSEGAQPAELGWGTHEKHFPADGGRHAKGSGCAIYLNRPGASTRVRTWTPKAGHFHGFLITHSEAISLADYFTVTEGGRAVYRPTSHYAYHPSDNAVLSVHEFAGRNWNLQDSKRIMLDDIIDGIDELGVLLAGHQRKPTGTDRSCRSRRRASWRPTTAPPACRSPLRCSPAWFGRWRTRGAESSSRMKWTSAGRSAYACPIWHGGRRLHRLDTALPARRAVRRGSRCHRSLAIQEYPGGLTRGAALTPDAGP